MSNWDIIQTRLKDLKQSGGEYRCPSPLRPDSDSPSFAIKPDADGMDGVWKDHVSEESGNFYQLAEKLNLTLAQKNGHGEPDSKRAYTSLEDYAVEHGLTAEYMVKAKWGATVEQKYCSMQKRERPALKFWTSGGDRWRFIDGQKPPFINFWHQDESKRFRRTWYYLERAAMIADLHDRPALILVNGEASVLAGQMVNLPATCVTSGGETKIPDNLLAPMLEAWSVEKPVWICQDCDSKGKQAAQVQYEQLSQYYDHVTVIDLELFNKGDFADFCKLHGTDAGKALAGLIVKQNPQKDSKADDKQAVPEPPSADVLHQTDYYRDDKISDRLFEMVVGKRAVTFRSFKFPLKTFRPFGGFMETCFTKKVTLIQAPSGDGKTQLLETINDNLNEGEEIDGMYWGSEWDEYEMLMRRYQRHSLIPLTIHMISNHLSRLGYEQDGVEDADRFGQQLTDDQFIEFVRLHDKFFPTWKGHCDFHGTESMVENDIDSIILRMENNIERARSKGRLIQYGIFDYVQLLTSKKQSNTDNEYETIFKKVKDFAKNANIHIFMTSQITKAATAAVKSGDREMTAADGHFIRPDKANLALALNRQYMDVGDVKMPTPCFKLSMLKSNLQGDLPEGKLRYEIELLMRPEKLYFQETEWSKQAKYRQMLGIGSGA